LAIGASRMFAPDLFSQLGSIRIPLSRNRRNHSLSSHLPLSFPARIFWKPERFVVEMAFACVFRWGSRELHGPRPTGNISPPLLPAVPWFRTVSLPCVVYAVVHVRTVSEVSFTRGSSTPPWSPLRESPSVLQTPLIELAALPVSPPRKSYGRSY